jgi:D-alanyl-lipoteichoic acid acyltransferase DltB (MBOAT superfamily)
MAIGLGRMFGLILPMNFNSPYKSTSVIEFWRRWHISLSFFVRDYVYIPLGGNKFGLPRQIFNLLFAFIIIGFWHGAGYMFITWGVYHGVLIVINYIIRHLKIPELPKLLSILFTFFLVVIGWSLFRVEDITQLENLYISIFSFTEGKTIFLEAGQQKLGIGLIIISAIITFLFPNTLEIIGLRWHGLLHGKKITMYKRLSRKVLLPILTGISLYFSVTSLEGFNSNFLYFNF